MNSQLSPKYTDRTMARAAVILATAISVTGSREKIRLALPGMKSQLHDAAADLGLPIDLEDVFSCCYDVLMDREDEEDHKHQKGG